MPTVHPPPFMFTATCYTCKKQDSDHLNADDMDDNVNIMEMLSVLTGSWRTCYISSNCCEVFCSDECQRKYIR